MVQPDNSSTEQTPIEMYLNLLRRIQDNCNGGDFHQQTTESFISNSYQHLPNSSTAQMLRTYGISCYQWENIQCVVRENSISYLTTYIFMRGSTFITAINLYGFIDRDMDYVVPYNSLNIEPENMLSSSMIENINSDTLVQEVVSYVLDVNNEYESIE